MLPLGEDHRLKIAVGVIESNPIGTIVTGVIP
jgi:hypothetical protein